MLFDIRKVRRLFFPEIIIIKKVILQAKNILERQESLNNHDFHNGHRKKMNIRLKIQDLIILRILKDFF